MFWKRKQPKTMLGPMRVVKKDFWDISIKYEDGSEKKYENALAVYPIGEHGSHLRIEFDGSGYHQASFFIISLDSVTLVEGQRREEEPEETSIP